LDETDRAMMTAKAVPQPWATYTQSLRLGQQAAPAYQQVAIACDDMRGMVAAGVPLIVAMAKEPWQYLEIETGHWPMFSAPSELADLLASLAREG
jgi:hypothetical protein